MIVRPARISWLLAGAVVLGAFASAPGQETPPRRGQPIQFSEPKRETGASNLNQIATQRTSLRELEDQLKRPFDVIDLEPPMDRMPLQRLPPPNLDSKRLKELFNKRKEREDWIFLSPDDYNQEMSMEEIFKIPEYDENGQLKQKSTPLERYFDRLEATRAGNTNEVTNKNFYGKERERNGSTALGASNSDDTPGADATTPEQILRRLFNSDTSDIRAPEVGKARTLAEMLGVKPIESPNLKRAQDARLEAYRQLLESPTLPRSIPGDPALMPFNRAPGVATSLTVPPSLSPVSRLTPQNPAGSLPVAAGVPQRPAELPGLASPPGLAASTTTPPEAPRTPVPPPGYNMPRRKF